MKRKDVFLFLSFMALFVLFAFYQNFSFPTGQLKNISQKKLFENQIRKFVPTYAFNSYIGENIEAPYGFKEEVTRRIASADDPIVFDDKKFVKDKLQTMPVYKDVKDLIDVSSSGSGEAPSCVENPIEPQNNCYTEYSGETNKSGSAKVRVNPFRQTASISVPGEIESLMMYDGDRNSINVQFKKELDENAGVKLQLDSQDQSGSVNIDVRW